MVDKFTIVLTSTLSFILYYIYIYIYEYLCVSISWAVENNMNLDLEHYLINYKTKKEGGHEMNNWQPNCIKIIETRVWSKKVRIDII